MFAGIKLLSYLYCYFIHKQLILGKFSKKNPVVLAWIFVKSSILYVRLGSEYASCIITNIVDLEHDFAWRATTVTPTSSYLCWGRLIIVSFPRRFIVTPFTRAIVYWKFWKSYGKKVKNRSSSLRIFNISVISITPTHFCFSKISFFIRRCPNFTGTKFQDKENCSKT